MAKFSESSARKFEQLSGYKFTNTQLLSLSLTHSSHRSGASKDYERLEFFGDRILGMVIAEWLYSSQLDADEGTMARQLTYLVRKGTCTLVAKDLRLGEIIRAGPGAGGKPAPMNDRMLGDACEAVIAAIYLDGGLDAARKFILKFWAVYFEKSIVAPRDSKSRLQEWALGKGLAIPEYHEISREGPDHGPNFIIEVRIPGYEAVQGEATSKKRGEQTAAEKFISRHGIRQE